MSVDKWVKHYVLSTSFFLALLSLSSSLSSSPPPSSSSQVYNAKSSFSSCPLSSVSFVRTMGYKTVDNILISLELISNSSSTQCYQQCQASPDCSSYFFHSLASQCYLVNSSFAPVITYNLEKNLNWNYHRKICLQSSANQLECKLEWFFDKIPSSQLHDVPEKIIDTASSEDDCMVACFNEKSFVCRSARYDYVRKICGLSRHDRRTSQELFRKHVTSTVSYLENQCIKEPPRCTFRHLDDYSLELSHVIEKSSAESLEKCEKRCLNNPSFVCRSFLFSPDHGSCWLSPEDTLSLGENAIKATNIIVSTNDGKPMKLYEKSSCIDVEVRCEASEMTAIIRTSGPFRGRLFTITHPQECYNTGNEETDDSIALSIPLHGGQCGTKNLGNGTYTNSLIVQRHPLILRETDRRIDVACDYRQIHRKLRSGKQVSEGDAIAMTQVVTGLASTPPVRLRVVNSTGNEVKGVELGDPLYLKVEMLDESVFGIFGSELVARSGEGSESVLLIDDQGCPVEPTVFPGLEKSDRKSKSLVAPFQAFRFASDPSVKFQMTVSFCLDTCSPVNCDKPQSTTESIESINEFKGRSRETRVNKSFGRKRRRRSEPLSLGVDKIYASPSQDELRKIDSLEDLKSGDILTDITMEATFFIVNNLKSVSQADDTSKLKHIRSLKHRDPNEKRQLSTQPWACNSSDVHFELISGSMLAANSYRVTRDLEPGQCLRVCLADESCLSVNIDYKKGICSFNGQNLRNSGVDRNMRSTPYFNYFEKVCLPPTTSNQQGNDRCSKDWAFERVKGRELSGLPFEKTLVDATTRELCELACLEYTVFPCLSAEFNYQMNECRLSPFNRFSSLNKQVKLEPSPSLVDYLENNCAQGPRDFCSWRSSKQNRLVLSDRTLITSNISSCQEECLQNKNFICRSFTYDSVSLTCSLSHHTRRSAPGASLLKTPSSVVFEITTCFDVKIDCGPELMKVKVSSSTLFQGKLYARERPTSCFVDIANSMDFSLPIQLKGEECGTTEESAGTFINTLVIQSNDHVVTAFDKAIGVKCSYDIGNITGETLLHIDQLALTDREHSSSTLPDLSFHIMDIKGSDKDIVNLGELLRVQVRMSDEDTYGIFIRNLVAKDGSGRNNLTLIDQSGCPVEAKLMREVRTIDKRSKSLESYFEAFSFTGSSTLELEAEVETCLERCRPVQCQIASGRSDDDYEVVVSYGRRRRRSNPRVVFGKPIDTRRMSKVLSIRSSQFGLESESPISSLIMSQNDERLSGDPSSLVLTGKRKQNNGYDKVGELVDDQQPLALLETVDHDYVDQHQSYPRRSLGTGFNLLLSEPKTLVTFIGSLFLIQLILIVIGFTVASRLRQFKQSNNEPKAGHFVSIYKP